MTRLAALVLAMLLLTASPAQAAHPAVTVYAAGSLRQAMTAVAKAFEDQTKIPVATTFGPSGVLRERLEKGEHADMLASADFGHPVTLAKNGQAWPTILFTRNKLCATGKESLKLSPDNLLSVLLDPAVHVGTSTPKADPAGDYAWVMFDLADKVKPGSAKVLDAKADKIVGGPNNSAPVNGKHPVAAAFEAGKIDVFLGYCSGDLHKTVPGLTMTQLPPELAVQADYGLAVLKDASPEARRFALYLMSVDGQKILADHGFAAVALP